MAASDPTKDGGLERDLEGRACKDQFSLTRRKVDLDEAIRLISEAVSFSSGSPVGRLHARLSNLGLWSLERLRSFGTVMEVDDVDVAVKAFERALTLVPEKHPRISFSKSNLSYAIHARANRDGQRADLDLAIDLAQQALDAVSEDQEHWLSEYRSNLAVLLQTRYLTYGNQIDLDHSIRLSVQALEAADEESEQYSLYLVSLCKGLQCRHDYNNNKEDLDNIIDLIWQAFEEAYDDDPFWYHLAEQLMMTFILRSQIVSRPLSERISDLDEAIDTGLWALKEEIATHEKGGILSHMAHAYRARWHILTNDKSLQEGTDADIDHAITYIKEAVASVDRTNYDYSSYSLELAICYSMKARALNLRTVLEQAAYHFSEAFSVESIDVKWRLRVAYQASFCLIKLKNWAELDSMLQYSMSHIREVGSSPLTRDDRVRIISSFNGFSALAASGALQNGRDAIAALNLLERGRGLIADLLMAARSDISRLDEPYRSQYRDLQEQLSSPVPWWKNTATPLFSGTNDLSAKRIRAFHRLQELERQIRTQPNHERFQLPPDVETMIGIAGADVMVSINVSILRADAFVVRNGVVEAVQLPELSLEDAGNHAMTLFQLTKHGARDGTVEDDEPEMSECPETDNPTLQDICIWLWDVAVHPILRHLGFFDQTTQMKHICWVNSGVMGLLPIHAAGTHLPGSTANLMSHAVTSYASSFKALTYSTQLTSQLTANDTDLQRIAIISMPTTPGGQHAPLNILEEVEAIQACSQGGLQNTLFTRPTKKELIPTLSSCDIVHFACHGVADPMNPSHSGLFIGRQELEKLSLGELDDLRRTPGVLAYLSACSTAELSDTGLVDENMHLASMFQAIGFRHIVGTKWSADDSTAGFVAKVFYKKLLGRNDGQAETKAKADLGRYAVPIALHEAILEARERVGSENISRWAPFLHMGW